MQREFSKDGTANTHRQLQRLIDEIPTAWETGRLAAATTKRHRGLVELAGNTTLTMIAGVLHEIFDTRMTAALKSAQDGVPKAQYSRPASVASPCRRTSPPRRWISSKTKCGDGSDTSPSLVLQCRMASAANVSPAPWRFRLRSNLPWMLEQSRGSVAPQRPIARHLGELPMRHSRASVAFGRPPPAVFRRSS